MDLLIFLVLTNLMYSQARFCEKTKAPFELGEWRGHMTHLDSATIENKPVSVNEGQVYVYENVFPGYIIRYINVDNLAQRTCGASGMIKRGGIGASSVLIVLHAASNQEIRSVIDVWGVKDPGHQPPKSAQDVFKNDEVLKTMRSRYLFRGMRTVNHNSQFFNRG